MKKFTVLLLCPDYIASDYGKDTYLEWIMAASPEDAIRLVQEEAFEGHGCGGSESPQDFHALAVFEGHNANLVNP